MAAKKREYIITEDDVDLLNFTYSSVRPLSKKPLELQDYKPKEKLSNIHIPNIRNNDTGIDAFDIGSSGGLKRSEQRKMDSGRFSPDITLDLHGMTLNEAFKALEKAIISAYENQNRLLLVITGKGRNSVLGSGALKRELPHWLSLSHIASKIIRASNAAPKDGGDGAFYILIKRLKS
jgi:DNA-nicking Smr family endonuclease